MAGRSSGRRLFRLLRLHVVSYALPALIANNYGEMMSIPLYDSALMAAALVLLLIVLAFTITARIILLQATRRAS